MVMTDLHATDRDSAGAVDLYIAAVSTPSDDSTAALNDALADEVRFVGPLGAADGRDAALTAATNPMLAGLMAGAEWSQPKPEGDHVSVRATLPPGRPLAGIDSTIWTDAVGRIERIVQEMIPAPPPPAAPLVLTEDIKTTVDNALAAGRTMTVAYVDAQGVPHLSLRGSTHVHGDDQLAMWIRDPNGGILRAIGTNPNIALLYYDPKTRTSYNFIGRARIETDPDTRARVYEGSAEIERNFDPMRRGVAVLVDLDRVEGGSAAGRVVLTRDNS